MQYHKCKLLNYYRNLYLFYILLQMTFYVNTIQRTFLWVKFSDSLFSEMRLYWLCQMVVEYAKYPNEIQAQNGNCGNIWCWNISKTWGTECIIAHIKVIHTHAFDLKTFHDFVWHGPIVQWCHQWVDEDHMPLYAQVSDLWHGLSLIMKYCPTNI